MSDHTGDPGELTEKETLARLTIEEKRRLARVAIVEFPHLDHATLDQWLHRYGAHTAVGESLLVKIDALLDRCETLVRCGENPEALDHFIYGQTGTVHLETLGIDPEEVADREPLDVWRGVYDD